MSDLVHLPTPVDDASRLSEHFGLELCIKRDDLTGLALGGNKARKLQYFMADARVVEADVIVTGGGAQSNHVRLTAAAARRCGFDAHVVLGGATAEELRAPSGNLLLDVLLDATFETLPTDEYNVIEAAIVAVADRLRDEGRRPYAIPVGGANPLGVRAYVAAATEFLAQRSDIDVVFVADGSGGTHAGLLAGFSPGGPRIVGVDVGTRPGLEAAIARLATFDTGLIVDHDHIGPGYGSLDAATVDAIRLAARTEGLLLDPVYTGKAFAALTSWVRDGRIAPHEKVCFWHTGGQPALFAEKYRGSLYDSL